MSGPAHYTDTLLVSAVSRAEQGWRDTQTEGERERENEGVRERFLCSQGGQNGWCMWRVGVCIMRVWEVTRVVQYVRGGPN